WLRSTNTFRQITPIRQENNDLGWIIRLLPENNNDLWAATLTGGLLHIDGSADKIVEQFLPDKSNANSISATNVKDMVMIGQDSLFLATSKGFDLFDIKRKSF